MNIVQVVLSGFKVYPKFQPFMISRSTQSRILLLFSKCGDWDGEVDCPEVMGPIVSFRKKRLQQLLKD